MKHFWLAALALLAPFGAGAQMMQAAEAPAISPGEALVVFLRPSGYGGITAASVFDVSDADNKLVGIVHTGTKVAYATKPGERTFMVMSESADFMRATLEAGRTYYALVTPRMGMWKTRFSFRPMRLHELDGGEFLGWDSATRYVSNAPAALNWAVQHAAEINDKRAQSFPDWLSKPEHQRASQTLNAGDGKPGATIAAAPAAAAAAPAAPTSPPDPSSSGVEVMFWESVRESKDPADLRAYLEQYPSGRFAPLARNRLAALSR